MKLGLPGYKEQPADAAKLSITARTRQMAPYDQLVAIVRWWSRCVYFPDRVDTWIDLCYFLLLGGGDCEDFAIAGYRVLRSFGWDRDNVQLLSVQGGHMVLAARLDHQWYVLNPADPNEEGTPSLKRFEDADVQPHAAYGEDRALSLLPE